MHVAFLVTAPSVRDYRLARGLIAVRPGLRISVIQEHEGYARQFVRLGHRYGEPILLRQRPEGSWRSKVRHHILGARGAGERLRVLTKELRVDVVHSQNAPHLGWLATRWAGRPVVHDLSDFYSIFPRPQRVPAAPRFDWRATAAHHWRLWLEAQAVRAASAVTVNSDEMAVLVQAYYAPRGPIVTIPNAVPRDDIPRTKLDKLSAGDGRTHAVFVGHLNEAKLAALSRVGSNDRMVHVYGLWKGAAPPTPAAEHLAFHPPLPYRELLESLTQYDWGLALWYQDAREPFFQASLPSKVFDYLAAGLPVAVGPYDVLRRFVVQHQCGVVLEAGKPWRDALVVRPVEPPPDVFTMETYAPHLAGLYDRLVR